MGLLSYSTYSKTSVGFINSLTLALHHSWCLANSDGNGWGRKTTQSDLFELFGEWGEGRLRMPLT